MSRKNLSRTVIEGGRSYYNSWARRTSHRGERATTREWLDRVADDPEYAEASAPPRRRDVGRSFHDKLGPAFRWLLSQVGRPWSKVFSDLCTRFDTRTIAGRHVVHDHMLAWVRRHDDISLIGSRQHLVIDRHGILRKPAWFGRALRKLLREARQWANGRIAAKTYRGWWWFTRVSVGAECPYGNGCTAAHADIAGRRYHGARFDSVGPMTAGQLRYLDRLPPQIRKQLVMPSPWPQR